MKRTLITGVTAVTVSIGLGLSSAVLADKPSFAGASPDVLNAANNSIVRFKDDVPRADVPDRARGLLARANAVNNASAKLKNIYQHSIKGFTLSMPCHAASRAFGDDPMVQALEVDSIVFMNPRPPGKGPGGGGGGDDTSPDPQVTPWGIARVGGPQDGTGYTAWVLDTGIDVDHPDLNVAASRGFSAFNKGKDSGVDDGQGHGTHVAGTIAAFNNNRDVVGVAAGASVVPIKVLDRRGSGSTSGVIAGVDFVGANASPGDCANMSLGGGISSSLDAAVINAAANSGAFFTLAAGNEGQDANNSSPARANGNNVFTISAHDSSDRLASFSNYGNPPVDYAAPGVGVLSTKKGGGTVTYSGTSMAAPHACAVLMLKAGNPSTDGTISNDRDSTPDPIIHL
ncbi:MAG: S8 family serine peptidase [Pseudomonadota bacterium]|nr:S8 family serine peptidase [Pseudomonadota bacterium]